MSEHFADRLLEACRDRGAPVCVGIDPVLERMPEEFRDGVLDPVTAIAAFSRSVLDAVAPHVPCVKIQSACFERYGWEGVMAFETLVRHAREQGLLVIGDAKRGDIGISAAHYAVGCLGDASGQERPRLGPDALTVNAYFGDDGLSPFTELAAQQAKGLVALVRTSNPGGDALQGLALDDGRTVADAVADVVAALGSDDAFVGESGYSLLGAVVGATKPDDARELRERMPQQLFLVPGYGAQGGSADDVRACFKPDGTGAVITASRSVLYAFEKRDDVDWMQAIKDAARGLRDEIAAILAG